MIYRSNHGTKPKTNSSSDGVIVQAKSQFSDYKDTELSHSDTVIATRYSDFLFFLLTMKVYFFSYQCKLQIETVVKGQDNSKKHFVSNSNSTLPPIPNNIRPDTTDLFCRNWNY